MPIALLDDSLSISTVLFKEYPDFKFNALFQYKLLVIRVANVLVRLT